MQMIRTCRSHSTGSSDEARASHEACRVCKTLYQLEEPLKIEIEDIFTGLYEIPSTNGQGEPNTEEPRLPRR